MNVQQAKALRRDWGQIWGHEWLDRAADAIWKVGETSSFTDEQESVFLARVKGINDRLAPHEARLSFRKYYGFLF